jgi:predicted Zn finger-like uncharacterized protein
MLLECPECHQQHTITTEQFQSSGGSIDCPNCSAQFDPLAHLSEVPTEQQTYDNPLEQSPTSYPWEKKRHHISASFWIFGTIVGISLFIGQLIHFKGEEFMQNRAIRPWLEQACDPLQCQLPIYRNIKQFSVLHSSFVASNKFYTLQAAISNQAEFPQQYPDLKLTLLNFSGSAIAKRVLKPKEYLNQDLPPEILSKSETFTIKLDLAIPHAQVGGFTIELI